ncbi:unnamed protein product, partial [Ectocarpus sp. 8 AP-2014]
MIGDLPPVATLLDILCTLHHPSTLQPPFPGDRNKQVHPSGRFSSPFHHVLFVNYLSRHRKNGPRHTTVPPSISPKRRAKPGRRLPKPKTNFSERLFLFDYPPPPHLPVATIFSCL